MSIVYSVITQNKKTILCEYTESSGNFRQICTQILNKMQFEKEPETKLFLDYDENFRFFILDVFIKDNKSELISSGYSITFMCLVNKDSFKEQMVFEFLNTIKNSFFQLNDDLTIKNSLSFSLSNFIEILRTEIIRYNVNLKKSTKGSSQSTKVTGLFSNTGKIYII